MSLTTIATLAAVLAADPQSASASPSEKGNHFDLAGLDLCWGETDEKVECDLRFELPKFDELDAKKATKPATSLARGQSKSMIGRSFYVLGKKLCLGEVRDDGDCAIRLQLPKEGKRDA